MSTDAPADEIALEKENRSLRQRVDELERTLSDMESSGHDTAKTGTVAWWKIALFGIFLLAILSPSYLVMRDRWLENKVYIEAVNEFWWDTGNLRTLAFPQYFLLIFISALLAVLIIVLWRSNPMLVFSNLTLGTIEPVDENRDTKRFRTGRTLLICSLILAGLSAVWMVIRVRIPSWELILALILFVTGQFLMDPRTASLWERIRNNARFLVDAGLLLIALCAALYALFGEGRPNLIFYVLLVFAGLNFYRHIGRTHVVFWISLAALIALAWNINSWYYVTIGDEYSFYTEVLNILDNRSAFELVANVFNGNFVYGTHPYLSSYIQDFFMKLFDNHNFGWRFSNPFLVACSLPFFYYFFRAFVPRRIALVTIILLGFSHYLLSFSKIGYNNLQALFAMSVVLASFTWALKSMRLIAFSLTGLAVGLCFYLYPATLYVIPLPALGLLIFMPPTHKEALRRWGWMISSAALLVFPLVIQARYWEAKIPGTFLYGDVGSSGGTLLQNILLNMLYSAFSYLYIPEQTHYVSTGYMDPLSSAFVLIGFVLLLKVVFQRNKSALFLAAGFLMMFFLVGATHGRSFPTATRMFLLLPWFALFTALGLEWIVETAGSMFHVNTVRIGNIVVALIVVVNLYQAYVVDIRNTAQYQSLGPMFVKTAREIKANSQVAPKSYAFVAPEGWNASGFEIIQRAYLVPDSPRQIINLPLEGDQLPDTLQPLVSQRDVVVIVKGDMEQSLLTQVGVQLQNWGKLMCEVRNMSGNLQFQLWHSGDLGWLCQ